jgi:hypothetical protein
VPDAEVAARIRLITRRRKLNLLELRPGRVMVQHWGQQGQADLRPFFKQHRLALKRREGRANPTC